MPASFVSSPAIDTNNKVPLSNGAACGSAKSAIAIGVVGLPNHSVTNFVAGSNALEYFPAPASCPRRLNSSNGGLEPSTYSAIANVGATVPKGFHPPFARISRPPPSAPDLLASVPQRRIGAASAAPPCDVRASLNSLPASRAFHRSTTSNRLLPSEKSADSVVIGYHATYPAPRTAVNEPPMWSQLVCRAISGGTPTRASRVASSGMTPSYPISSSAESLGLIAEGKVTTASESAPVW